MGGQGAVCGGGKGEGCMVHGLGVYVIGRPPTPTSLLAAWHSTPPTSVTKV